MLKKLLKAPEGSAQQGFHLVSFGQDENLVISRSGFKKNIMRFQRKKIRKQIEDVLNMYIETEKYPPEMINRILEIVKSEHIAKEHFRKQRDNAIIRYDYSKSNKHQISN